MFHTTLRLSASEVAKQMLKDLFREVLLNEDDRITLEKLSESLDSGANLTGNSGATLYRFIHQHINYENLKEIAYQVLADPNNTTNPSVKEMIDIINIREYEEELYGFILLGLALYLRSYIRCINDQRTTQPDFNTYFAEWLVSQRVQYPTTRMLVRLGLKHLRYAEPDPASPLRGTTYF